MFEVYVSIDILRGRVVRLVKGDPSRAIVYSDDPVEVADRIVGGGVRMIHIVDLDAAIHGRRSDTALRLVKRLKDLGVFISFGGGVRTLNDIAVLSGYGIDRVVVGTALHRGLIPVDRVIEILGDKAVVSIDYRSNRVAINGWRETIELSPTEAIELYIDRGFSLFLMTNIELDGTLSGLNIEALESIDKRYRGMIIVSGGVRSVSDLKTVRDLGFRGVVVGRAFYEGLISIKDILGVSSHGG